MNDPSLSYADRIILAGDDLEQSGQSPFSAEALIVAAWRENKVQFGLKGDGLDGKPLYGLYPCSNRILTYVVGERGLIRRGYFAKMGQKLYILTRQGRLRAHQLTEAREDRIAAHRQKLLAARA